VAIAASVTISTVGYGDITPTGHDTQILTAFLLLIALMFIANELGSVLDLIRESVAEKREKAILRQQSKNNHPLDAQFIALGFKAVHEEEHSGNPFGMSDVTLKVRVEPIIINIY
jgi:voltage-gated potassium channel Kch